MKGKDYRAFIVEGNVREPQIIDNICKVHLKDKNFQIITIPAGQNIYMLWKKMREDDFNTDIIEVLRESSSETEELLRNLSRDDFSEVYLFFDYDGQQDNLSLEEEDAGLDVISLMLASFDNETENGKLYISYPMVEALRDYTPDQCGNERDCYCRVEDFGVYKHISAARSFLLDFKKYAFSDWRDIINVFAMRVSCLFGKSRIFSHLEYKTEVTPETIYELQISNIKDGMIFILSAFPEFLLDYFGDPFWNACIIHKKILSEKCSKVG